MTLSAIGTAATARWNESSLCKAFWRDGIESKRAVSISHCCRHCGGTVTVAIARMHGC